jgi:hypothetical protein
MDLEVIFGIVLCVFGVLCSIPMVLWLVFNKNIQR